MIYAHVQKQLILFQALIHRTVENDFEIETGIRERPSDEDEMMINDKETDERDAAGNDHDNDERLEPLVIDELVDDTSQCPPLLSGDGRQRRLPAGVLPVPAGRTTVLRVLDMEHRNVRHRVYGDYSQTRQSRSAICQRG